jgi:phthiodiolone/phenolphthiodiolone dimycocerosates ketoreductase
VWARHGAEHPCGEDSNGFVDVVVHALDPEELRALAPTIPFGVVEEMLVVGNDEDVVQRLGAFAENGLEHVVLGLMTGLVGGANEMFARMPMLGVLRERLKSL